MDVCTCLCLPLSQSPLPLPSLSSTPSPFVYHIWCNIFSSTLLCFLQETKPPPLLFFPLPSYSSPPLIPHRLMEKEFSYLHIFFFNKPSTYSPLSGRRSWKMIYFFFFFCKGHGKGIGISIYWQIF